MPLAVLARSSRSRAAAVVAALATSLAVLVAPDALPARAATTVSFGSASPGAVLEGTDYAEHTFSDAWDYSNAADIHVFNGAAVSGGLLRAKNGGGFVPWLVPYMPGSQPLGRDGPLNPINAAYYTHFSARIYSPASGAGGLWWFKCSWANNNCVGFMPVWFSAGWHTYDFAIKGNAAYKPASWTCTTSPCSNAVLGMRISIPGSSGSTYYIDWARLYHPTTNKQASITWNDTQSGERVAFHWNRANACTTRTSIPRNASWGPIVSITSSSSGTNTLVFPQRDAGKTLDALPPGKYFIYAKTSSGIVCDPTPVRVLAQPEPIVLSPGFATGMDYARYYRNPWDMSQTTDARIYNARNVKWSNGVVFATNTSNDPNAVLRLPIRVNGNIWHRLQFSLWYSGNFSLSGSPGGGCVARLIWRTQDSPTVYQNSDDIVIYPGWNVVQLDLKTNPSYAITDPDQPQRRIGWQGHYMVEVRLDPNEDPGARTWGIDYVKIAEDEIATTAYNVAFKDPAWQGNETAYFYADPSPGGLNGYPIGHMTLTKSSGTFHWSIPSSFRNGEYWIYVKLVSPRGTVYRYSPGAVVVHR